MDIKNIKTVAIKSASRSGLIIKKFSPEILLAVGITGMVGCTILACKATLKVDATLAKSKEDISKIKTIHNDESFKDQYSENDYKKDLTIVYVQRGAALIKLYGPATTIGMLSIFCILSSKNIMSKRNAALLSAYKIVEKGFAEYRQRVSDELGIDKERQFKYGIKNEVVQEMEEDKDGKKRKVKKSVAIVDPNALSIYSKFFDEACPQWTKTPEYNLVFLKCQQNYANDLLHARGHLFLNEVYDMLGIPRTQAGSVVGWVIGEGDNFVDFGIYEISNMERRAFVNGYERSILLDFNVDGVIYDLI